ncbi:MAG: alanine racemase [Synechococcus sp. SB0673_bin_10]|nr:alanine racemase [Synechococcus sp. SB0667_bin_8]MYG63930.1 alanine racemase [Synechococcus sp. SB0675_bin_7]MYI72421.1 alanine racemase [Synechococcus sp. SB0673_bin_10]MYK86266.1 alanine racemase [Synechococcus sp. SB0669_bin_7]
MPTAPTAPPCSDSQPESTPVDFLQDSRAWVEVDEGAITHNTRLLRQRIGPHVKLMAVVKANGYGHGDGATAKAARAGGADAFAVASLAEAVGLRRQGLREPILVLGHLSLIDEVHACLRWRLLPTISTLDQARLFHIVASRSGACLPVHVNLDTGMARLGVPWREGVALIQAILRLDGLQVEGVYSHLAAADAVDPSLTQQQQQRFDHVVAALTNGQPARFCRHLANSAAAMADSSLHYDMVRVGLALYGHAPAEHLEGRLALRPAMAVRARVTILKTVPAGTGVSYDHRYHTKRPSRLAVVAIGYADGVPRLLSNHMGVLHRGRWLPQVGSITMDQLMVDATDDPQLHTGAVVTLLGHDGTASISPLQWSQTCSTIPWDILCGFSSRLPRLRAARSTRHGGQLTIN